MPPSRRNSHPVRNLLVRAKPTASPNSEGLPIRPKGVALITGSAGSVFPIGVSNSPGIIVTTRICKVPKSLAIGKVIPAIAPFVLE